MPLSIRCPRGHKLNVPSKFAGQTVRCPACQSRIVVPGERPAVAAAVKDEVAKASPPKLPISEATSIPAATEEFSAEEPAVSAADVAAIETTVGADAEIPAPPAFVPKEPPALPVTTAAAVAFAPDDPSTPLPMGGIVPGANQQNSLAKLLRERKLMISELGYRADRMKRHSVYWLAGSQFALALFATLPAVWQMTAAQPAPWVYLVLCLSLVQMTYSAWLALAPDYSSAEVGMFATGVLAAVYAAAMSACMLIAPRAGGWLQLGSLKMEYGSKPTLWCASMVLLASLTAYLCGHVSHRWRKSYRQLTLGAK